MTYYSHAAATRDAAPPLTPTQRRVVRDLLHRDWFTHVDRLTTLSVQFHGDELSETARRDVDTRLATIRRVLVDIEAALARLTSGTYGRCDACERRIPFEQLENRPHARWCRRCQPHPDGGTS